MRSPLPARCGVALLCLLAAAAPGFGARSVGYERLKVLGVWTHVVTANMDDPGVKVTVDVAVGFPGSAEPFSAFIRRSQPAAAVTGTFFSKTSLLPVGAIVIDGSERYFGGLGSAMAITPDNNVSFRRVPYGRHVDWREYETVLACGPTLLKGGVVDVKPRAEGFSDPRVLGRAPRVAVGLTARNKLRMISVSQAITLSECAKILKVLGCREAMNLDGGTSSALYYWGRTIVSPGRALTDLLVVHENVPAEKRYAAALPELKAKYREHKRRERAQQRFEAARTLWARGERAAAIDQFKLTTDADPTNASYHAAFAEALDESGRRRDAAAEWVAAGEAQRTKDLLPQAQASLRNALVLNPLHPTAHRTLADVYEAQGMVARAAQERRVADSVVLALATIGGVPSEVHDVYAPLGGPGSEPALAAYQCPLDGSVSGRMYVCRANDFSVEIPEGWQFVNTSDPSALNMQHISKPMRAVLRIFPMTEPTAPAAFAELYFAGTFREQLDARHTLISGRAAYEVRARERIGGATIESQTAFVLRGSDVFVLSRVAPAEQRIAAAPDFAYIRTHFEFRE